MRRFFVLLLAAAALTACGKAGMRGPAVRFRVSGDAPAVRAAFSGDLDENGVERIDWEKGDLIRILSPQAVATDGGDGHAADYRVDGVREGGASSFATVEPAGETGLAWGEGAHDFFAVSPAPSENGGTSLEEGVYYGEVPAAQTQDWDGPNGIPARSAVCLLAAVRGIEEPRNETVTLAFRPVFTALSFTLSLEDSPSVLLRSFRLESTQGPLAGPFQASMGEDDWTFGTTGRTTRSVSIDLDRTLERGTPVTFTVLCLPLDLSGLKAVFETAQGTKTLTLSRKDGLPLVFPACHKARITGLVLPGSPDISFTVDLIPWDEDREDVEAEPATPEND